jgi:hypothetical protein
MAGIVSVIIVLILSFLITRIATVMLIHTGLSKDTAQFQARSAFTGVGYTTSESESLMNNPLRRRILLALMILGNAGIITGVSSLILGFTGLKGGSPAWVRILALLGGILLLYLVARSHWVERKLSVVISAILRRTTKLDVKDYSSLLNLSGDYTITEFNLNSTNWLCSRVIRETKLWDEGTIILAIRRKDGTFIGAPQADMELREGDTLVLYGRDEAVEGLENRKKGLRGNAEHEASVENQKSMEAIERSKDAESKKRE